MSICLREDHYPFPEPPNRLTADPRLHNYEAGTPCEYRYICALGHVTVRMDVRAYVLCGEVLGPWTPLGDRYQCRRHAK